MPAIDALKLLEPVSAAQPCGRNLDYTPELLELEAAAKEPEEPGLKDQTAVDTRNWGDVLSRADKLLRESKDLRVAALLTRALLRVHGLDGYCAGLGVVTGIVERFWDGLYPPLDPGDADPMERLNALRDLWNAPTLSELRATPLVSVRGLGEFSLNDVLIAKGTQKPRPGATPPSPQHVLKGLESGVTPELHALALKAQEQLKSLDSLVRQKVGDSYGFETTALRDVLARIVLTFAEYVRLPAAPVGESPLAEIMKRPGQTSEAGAAGIESGSRPMQIVGDVQSREDVLQMLDKICRYYEQHEPSSPVPLLMQRARRLAAMNFIEIMRDLADKGLPQVEAVTGKETKA